MDNIEDKIREQLIFYISDMMLDACNNDCDHFYVHALKGDKDFAVEFINNDEWKVVETTELDNGHIKIVAVKNER